MTFDELKLKDDELRYNIRLAIMTISDVADLNEKSVLMSGMVAHITNRILREKLDKARVIFHRGNGRWQDFPPPKGHNLTARLIDIREMEK